MGVINDEEGARQTRNSLDQILWLCKCTRSPDRESCTVEPLSNVPSRDRLAASWRPHNLAEVRPIQFSDKIVADCKLWAGGDIGGAKYLSRNRALDSALFLE